MFFVVFVVVCVCALHTEVVAIVAPLNAEVPMPISFRFTHRNSQTRAEVDGIWFWNSIARSPRS